MEYRVVPMTCGHLEQVAEMEKDCFDDPWSRRVLEDSLANENSSALVAEDGAGALLGYIFFTAVLDEGGVDNLAVSPAARRRGIGGALMDAFHRWCRERELTAVYLEVRPSNAGAAALYRKLGYQEVGRRKNYYLDPKEDAIIMRLELMECI